MTDPDERQQWEAAIRKTHAINGHNAFRSCDVCFLIERVTDLQQQLAAAQERVQECYEADVEIARVCSKQSAEMEQARQLLERWVRRFPETTHAIEADTRRFLTPPTPDATEENALWRSRL